MKQGNLDLTGGNRRVKAMQEKLVSALFANMQKKALEKLETWEAQLLSDLSVERYKKDLNTKSKEHLHIDEVYWTDNHIDLFESQHYKSDAGCEFLPEWFELAYHMKRNYPEKVKEMAKELNLGAETVLKESGDTVLHVCA